MRLSVLSCYSPGTFDWIPKDQQHERHRRGQKQREHLEVSVWAAIHPVWRDNKNLKPIGKVFLGWWYSDRELLAHKITHVETFQIKSCRTCAKSALSSHSDGVVGLNTLAGAFLVVIINCAADHVESYRMQKCGGKPSNLKWTVYWLVAIIQKGEHQKNKLQKQKVEPTLGQGEQTLIKDKERERLYTHRRAIGEVETAGDTAVLNRSRRDDGNKLSKGQL